MLAFLEKTTQKLTQVDFPLQSRVHPLNSFFTPHLQCYIKRDDELGSMGSKMRKFSALIPYLLKEKTDEAVVIGGMNSNHVLGIIQLLIENGIEPSLFLCQNHQEELKGNALLIKLLIPESQIHCINRQEWPHVQATAEIYAKEKSSKKKVVIIPEGGCMPEAFPGALTLPCDIIHNEKKVGFSFQHFFVDSGTGLMAIGLILGLAFLEHPGHVHVILIAGQHNEFLEKLKFYHQHFCSLMDYNCPWPTRFSLDKPQQTKAFGATSPRIFNAIRQIAQDEGVLCDPIYNAKLFLEAKRKIKEEMLDGKALIIHSGGTLSLLGFLPR